MDCPWCGEAVLDGEAYPPEMYGPDGTCYHRECWVRRLVGSVAQLLGLPIGQGSGEWPAPGDPPGYTRAEAAAVAAKLAVDLTAVPEELRESARTDAREMVRLLGTDMLFAWRPGVAAN